jgi:hypothetical protein
VKRAGESLHKKWADVADEPWMLGNLPSARDRSARSAPGVFKEEFIKVSEAEKSRMLGCCCLMAYCCISGVEGSVIAD